jgi:integrase
MARRRKPAVAVKRCDCVNPTTCAHPWWTQRLPSRGGPRQRVNLSKLFPDEPVEVAAAKAKDLARKGLIKDGELVNAQPARLTCRYVATKYAEVRQNRKEQYYLDGLMDTTLPAGDGSTTMPLGDKPVDDVLTRDIKHAATLWRSRPTAKAGAAGGANAVRHLLQTARHFFRWAVEEGYTSRTPFRSPQGDPLIHISASKPRKRRLQEGEYDRITAVAEPYIRDFLDAMLETGCRPGELRTLQWSEVKPDHFAVLASKAKDREDREVPIMPMLATIFERRRKGPDGDDLPSEAYVFGDETGRLVSRERLCERWRRTCVAAKVHNLHLHDLRAEFASQLSESNVPIEQVRDALGHSTITMTNTYLRTRLGALKQAYQRRSQQQARKRLKVVRGNGPQLAHGDSNASRAGSS